MELILFTIAVLVASVGFGYWLGRRDRGVDRVNAHARQRRLRLGMPDPTVEPDELRTLVWPGHCSDGDTYDHDGPAHRNGMEVAP